MPSGDVRSPADRHARAWPAGTRCRVRHGAQLHPRPFPESAGRPCAARVPIGWRNREPRDGGRAGKGTTVIDNAARRQRSPTCTSCSTRWARKSSVLAHRPSRSMSTPRARSQRDHTVIPDRIEAATYLCAVGIRVARSPSPAPVTNTCRCCARSSARWGCGSRMTPTAFGRSPHGA